MNMIISTAFLALALASSVNAAYKLQERYAWKSMDYAFPDEYSRQQALLSGAYIPENNLPVGMEIWKNKMFISVPRWRDGIPATLNYIQTDAAYSKSPQLIPYPSLQGNELGNCANGLSTVYRIKADVCGRLWVLDTGTFGIGNTTTNPCPYAINVFDLATDRRIRRYELRAEDINVDTFIANLALDIGSSCEDTFAYMSDELGYGLIVYSWEQNTSWRFEHSFFLPDPLFGDFNIAGLNFQWYKEGIFGMALTPTKQDGFKTLFFSPIASNREFAVSTRVLRDSSRIDDSWQDFTALESRAPNGHLSSKIIDDNGVMFFNMVDQKRYRLLELNAALHSQNHAIVDKDDVGLVFPNEVKIDDAQNLWIMSDRMPVFLEADLDFNDVNFRIYSAPISELIRGTVCEATNPFNQYAIAGKQNPQPFFQPQYKQRLNTLPWWAGKPYQVYEH